MIRAIIIRNFIVNLVSIVIVYTEKQITNMSFFSIEFVLSIIYIIYKLGNRE